MPGTAVRFKTAYQNYDPATIFEVDQATKTLKPFGSGQAYQDAGFQFGQEQVVDHGAYQGFSVGPIINGKDAALAQVKNELNQFQNSTFSEQTAAPKRAASTLTEKIAGASSAVDSGMAEFNTLVEKYKSLQNPNYQQAYTDLRTEAGIPGLEKQYTDVRATRRELPYTERAVSGNAGVMTENQLGANVAQKDIPLGIQEQNTIDRMQLASDFVNQALKFKELDATTARTALENAISLVTQSVTMQRTQLTDAQVEKDKQQTREDQALQFRLENGISTPFFNAGGTIYDSGSLEGIPDEKTFQQKYGMTLQDAEARGLVGKLDASAQQDKALVLDLASNYPDAGILTSDTLQSAQLKLKDSKIYQKQASSSSGGGSGGGTLAGTNIVDPNVDAGVRSIISSKPGDGGYGDTYNAIKAKYGEAVANKYDQVYQQVFNQGVSVDAAFNNLKMGTPSGPVDMNGKAVKLSPGQISNIADWNTVSDLADQTQALGEKIGFSGVGGGYQGTIAQFMAKNFGSGTAEEEQLRNLLSNIKGTLAKARGGTSFTPNEQKLLDSYTPGIDDSPLVIQAKLTSLQQFIDNTIGNIYKTSGAVNVQPDNTVTQSDGSVWQVNQDGTYTRIK